MSTQNPRRKKRVLQSSMANTLYYGDNLEVLRKYIKDESVDLIYLDPPFNSKRDYNLLFTEQSGEPAQSQIKAFTDTWKWSELAYVDLCETCENDQAIRLVSGFVATLGRNDVTAYLVMMTSRLVELHRVLTQSGSLFLHCDPSASHYLKTLLDTIFGANQFRNEIIWHYNTGGKGKKTFLRKHDVIFWYTKSNSYKFFRESVVLPRKLGTAHLKHGFDEEGREYYEDFSPRKSGKQYRWYLDEGVTPMDVWTDIPAINPSANERLGYPTQKPVLLLNRIIEACSKEGDVVLDPFCGCGTAIESANRLGRSWIGIDITNLAVSLIKARIADVFRDSPPIYSIVGEPVSESVARALAEKDKYEFQKWAISLVPRAFPYQSKKGSDGGIDGILRFIDNPKEDQQRCLIQVKGGSSSVKDIRDLKGTMRRENAAIGMFICLNKPTQPMQIEAESDGFYVSFHNSIKGEERIPRLQIRTVGQLLSGKGFDLPFAASIYGTKQAKPIQQGVSDRQKNINFNK